MKKVRLSGPFFVANKNKSGRKNRSSYSRLFVINTNSDWLCGLSEKPRHIPVVVNVYFIRRRLLRESRHCHYVSCESHYKSGACRQADIAYRECEALRTAELLRVVRQRILRFRNTNRELVFAELFNFGNCFFRIRGEYNISGAVNLLCKNIQLFLYRKLFVIYGLKVSFFCLNRFNDLFGKLLSAFSAAGKYLRKRNRDVFLLAKSLYRLDLRFGITRQTGYRNHRPLHICWLLERVFPGPGINEQGDELSVTDLHPSDLRSDPGRRNPDRRAVSAVSTELQQISGGSKGIHRPCSYADCISVPAEILCNRYYTGSSKRIMKYTKSGFLKRNRKPLFLCFSAMENGGGFRRFFLRPWGKQRKIKRY